MINSFVPDYMHAVILGVVKLLFQLWFSSKNHDKPFYIGLKLNQFTERLLRCKPPKEVTRTPQPLDEHYKASEWKNLLIYYSVPCLKGLLPTKYLNHWYLFTYSMTIFLKDIITDEEFISAENALDKFVKDFESLYGLSNMR